MHLVILLKPDIYFNEKNNYQNDIYLLFSPFDVNYTCWGLLGSIIVQVLDVHVPTFSLRKISSNINSYQ